MNILAFSFLQYPAAGEEQSETAEFSGYLRRCKSQAEYPPQFGVTSDTEINKNQYKVDEISYLQK